MKLKISIVITIFIILVGCINSSKVSVDDNNTPIVKLTSTNLPIVNSITLTPIFSNPDLVTLIEDPICDLPCWWIITPGQTNWLDAKKTLNSLGLTPILYKGNQTHLIYDAYYHSVNLSLYVSKQNKIVDFIAIDNFLIEEVVEAKYRLYSPKEIILKYGQPSRIYLIASGVDAPNYGDQENMPYYQMFFFYDKEKFLIIYTGDITATTEAQLSICPTFENGDINKLDIYIQSVLLDAPLIEEHYASRSVNNNLPYLRTVDGATEMNIEEFSNFILTNPDTCFFMKK